VIVILLNAGLCSATGISSTLTKPSPSFEPNIGQADARVMFLAHTGTHVIYFTHSGLEISGIELQFQGGNCAAPSGRQPLSERHNYFRSADSRLSLDRYSNLPAGPLRPDLSGDRC
jgi:predicted membrane metal-binding protein